MEAAALALRTDVFARAGRSTRRFVQRRRNVGTAIAIRILQTANLKVLVGSRRGAGRCGDGRSPRKMVTGVFLKHQRLPGGTIDMPPHWVDRATEGAVHEIDRPCSSFGFRDVRNCRLRPEPLTGKPGGETGHRRSLDPETDKPGSRAWNDDRQRGAQATWCGWQQRADWRDAPESAKSKLEWWAVNRRASIGGTEHRRLRYFASLQLARSSFRCCSSLPAAVQSPSAILLKPGTPCSRPFQMITITICKNTPPKSRRRLIRMTPTLRAKEHESSLSIFSAKRL